MGDQEQIAAQVREIIASASTAASLSDKLFGPNGLFNVMALTMGERKLVASSQLFRSAQAKFRALQSTEAAAFSRAVKEAGASFPAEDHRIKLEHIEASQSR